MWATSGNIFYLNEKLCHGKSTKFLPISLRNRQGSQFAYFFWQISARVDSFWYCGISKSLTNCHSLCNCCNSNRHKLLLSKSTRMANLNALSTTQSPPRYCLITALMHAVMVNSKAFSLTLLLRTVFLPCCWPYPTYEIPDLIRAGSISQWHHNRGAGSHNKHRWATNKKQSNTMQYLTSVDLYPSILNKGKTNSISR